MDSFYSLEKVIEFLENKSIEYDITKNKYHDKLFLKLNEKGKFATLFITKIKEKNLIECRQVDEFELFTDLKLDILHI